MTGLLGNLALVAVFAWVIRALLGARELTWRRMVAAVLLGFALGATLAGLVLVDLTQLGQRGVDPGDLMPPTGELSALALRFQVIATMVVVVAFELLFARPPRRRELRVSRATQEPGIAGALSAGSPQISHEPRVGRAVGVHRIGDAQRDRYIRLAHSHQTPLGAELPRQPPGGTGSQYRAHRGLTSRCPLKRGELQSARWKGRWANGHVRLRR